MNRQFNSESHTLLLWRECRQLLHQDALVQRLELLGRQKCIEGALLVLQYGQERSAQSAKQSRTSQACCPMEDTQQLLRQIALLDGLELQGR
jgi:hypothetical protein